MIFRSGSTAFVSRSVQMQSVPMTSSTRTNTRRYSPYVLALLVAASAAIASPSHADTSRHGGSVTVMPGATRVAHGLSVAVISATSTSGSEDDAQRAMVAANAAFAITRGFVPVPTSVVTTALRGLSGDTLDTRNVQDQRMIASKEAGYGEQATQSDARIPIDTLDLRMLSKRLKKVGHAASVFVTAGDNTDTRANYSAVVEVYDLKTGGVVNRGEGTFTANVDAEAAGAQKNTNTSIIDGVANTAVAKGEQLALRALGGAVFRAVQELNRPLELRGAVVSLPQPYQARLSLSSYKGLRNGARIQYLENGVPVAYGTIVSVGAGEALATIAPENALPGIYPNMEVRNVSNPALGRYAKNTEELDDEAFRKFERDFGIGLAVLGIAYLAFKNDPTPIIIDPAL